MCSPGSGSVALGTARAGHDPAAVGPLPVGVPAVVGPHPAQAAAVNARAAARVTVRVMRVARRGR